MGESIFVWSSLAFFGWSGSMSTSISVLLCASEAPRRQVGAVVVALVALAERGELGDDGAGQLLACQFLVGGVVELGHLAGQAQAAGRLFAPWQETHLASKIGWMSVG